MIIIIFDDVNKEKRINKVNSIGRVKNNSNDLFFFIHYLIGFAVATE